MKKLLIVIFTVLASNAFGQQSLNYYPFKVDIMGGWNLPLSVGNTNKGGLGFSIEPKINLSNNLAVYYKYERSILYSVNFKGSGENLVSRVNSHLFGSEYYFGDSNSRFFIGGGLALYHPRYIKVNSTIDGLEDVKGGRGYKLGVSPRIGLQAGHFRLSTEYNAVRNNEYLAIKIGFTLGGGHRSEEDE